MIEIRLQELLERECYTCAGLSRRTGIPYSVLLRMKNGTGKTIQYDHLEKLCKALRCQPDDLIAYTRTE